MSVLDDGLLWVVDDRPSTRFPIYTRGNTGEVYPNVITPLCGSVVKEALKVGQEQAFLEMGAVVRGDLTEADRGVLTGCFGGYLYANLSLARVMGARTPGMKPEDIDTQMFGTSDAPPYRRQPGDRSLAATRRLAAFAARALRGPDLGWLQRERADVDAWVASRPAPSSASDGELLATVDAGVRLLPPLMRSLLIASGYGGVAASVLERMAANADAGMRSRMAVGVGGVESAAPAAALWALGRLAADSAAVGAAFDGGPGVAARLAALDDAAAGGFLAALHAFVDRFGARGPDEWELASDTWGTCPDIALAAVERIRHAVGPDPAETQAALAAERAEAVAVVAASAPLPMRRLVRRAARTVAEGAAAREFAKGTIVTAMYGMRLALFELVRRAQDNGGPAERRDCWLVTRDELPAFVRAPGSLAHVVAARRERRDLLQSRVPPFVFEGDVGDPESWPRRDASQAKSAGPGARLRGIGVSPGVACGPARVVRDPSDPAALEPGDVLVAPITDPAWTPLFLVASAVVCDVGANLSHAAIVAREMGIPAVVSVDDATAVLRDGMRVEVDGTNGVVSVVA